MRYVIVIVAIAFFTLNGFIQGLAVAPFFSLPAVLAPRATATVAATAISAWRSVGS